MDRAAFAFVAGYQAALHHLIPELPADALISLCVTERAGNRPRDIHTALTRDEQGLRLDGQKTFCLAASTPGLLLVAARERTDEHGRPRLVVARLRSTSPGVSLMPQADARFVPEATHATVEFAGARVSEHDLLPGDGYDRYVKPFRTVEDLCVSAALFAYQLGVARRFDVSHERVEQLATALVALRALVFEDPADAAVHVALAGHFALASHITAQLERVWERAEPAERDRWQRDRVIGAVASGARAARRQRAWERLAAAT